MTLRFVIPLAMVGLVLLASVFLSGCSTQRQEGGGPQVTMPQKTVSMDQRERPTIAQSGEGQRTLPTRPSGSIPSVRPTVPSTLPGSLPVTLPQSISQNITAIYEAATELSAEWDANGLTCTDKSCTGQFVNTAGDTLTITTTNYASGDEAHTAYLADKAAHAGDRTMDLTTGDESFAWQRQVTTSGADVREQTILAQVTYIVKNGKATMEEAAAIATQIAKNIP